MTLGAGMVSGHPQSVRRLYDRRWANARLAFLREHPLCVLCQREGRTVGAEVVDHVIPHKGDLGLFWDRGNWQPLCKPHHDGHKQSIEKGGKGRQTIGPDGWPLA